MRSINEGRELYASAARTAAPANIPVMQNTERRGAQIIVDVTAIGVTNEVQELAVDATGGDFTITFDGETTPALDFDVTAAAMQAALEALASVGAGNVSVSGGPGDDGGTTPYVIEFIGDLANADQPEITADATNLTGGAGTATPSTTTAGGAAESPSVVFKVQGRDPASGKFYDLLESAAITAVGTTVLTVYPGIAAAANSVADRPLSTEWRVLPVHADTDEITYSVGVHLLN